MLPDTLSSDTAIDAADLATTLRVLAALPSLPRTHPDFIAASPRRVVYINPGDESVLHIEPLLIVSLDFPAGAAPAQPGGGATNGPSGQGSGAAT